MVYKLYCNLIQELCHTIRCPKQAVQRMMEQRGTPRSQMQRCELYKLLVGGGWSGMM